MKAAVFSLLLIVVMGVGAECHAQRVLNFLHGRVGSTSVIMTVGETTRGTPEIYGLLITYTPPTWAQRLFGKKPVIVTGTNVSFAYRDPTSFGIQYMLLPAEAPMPRFDPREILILPNATRFPGMGTIIYRPTEGTIELPRELSVVRSGIRLKSVSATVDRDDIPTPHHIECVANVNALASRR